MPENNLGFPVVGFVGFAGSGKTEAAKYLVERYGYVRERMAGPLKSMLRALGLSDRELDGDLKEEPCELLCGKTPRWAMQALGTEYGRRLLHEDIWAVAWLRRADNVLSGGAVGIVADDIRFPNEVEAIHKLDGLVIRVDRPDAGRRYDHASEAIEMLPVDALLENDGSIEDLHRRVDQLIQFVA